MDAREFKETFLPMSDKLYRFALRFSRDHEEAEDIVQEVFLKLLKMGEKVDTYRSKEALAFTVTRNLCLDKIKARHTVSMEEPGILEKQQPEDPPDVQLDRKEKVKNVMQIVHQLPETQRAILHMRDVEGLGFEEIAETVNMTVNNVRVVLSRARKSVREAYIKTISNETGTDTKAIREIL